MLVLWFVFCRFVIVGLLSVGRVRFVLLVRVCFYVVVCSACFCLVCCLGGLCFLWCVCCWFLVVFGLYFCGLWFVGACL